MTRKLVQAAWGLARTLRLRVPLATPRRYTLAELEEFEHSMGVELPSSYKSYLVEVGAGEFFGIKVSLLEDWCQPCSPDELPRDFLSRPFPYAQAWNDRSLLDPDLGWRASYFDRLLCCGSMRVRNLGCESYHLLVLSGPERGNIWCDDRAGKQAGIYPLPSKNTKRLTVEEYLR